MELLHGRNGVIGFHCTSACFLKLAIVLFSVVAIVVVVGGGSAGGGGGGELSVEFVCVHPYSAFVVSFTGDSSPGKSKINRFYVV